MGPGDRRSCAEMGRVRYRYFKAHVDMHVEGLHDGGNGKTNGGGTVEGEGKVGGTVDSLKKPIRKVE